MALLEIKDLVKIYVETAEIKTPALRGISLRIEEGSFIAIAGPSGSGKTTLLNLIGALDKPTSGSVHYDGKEITAIPVNKLSDFRLKEIGFVFQSYNLINTLTALENTEYVMLLQRLPARIRRERSEYVLKRVGLGEFMNKRPNRMSGGQQQRVAVARAIVSGARLILADEPTANLDSATAGSLLDLMKELNREKKVTFIFSTHDKLVMDKADKVYKIGDGKIIN